MSMPWDPNWRPPADWQYYAFWLSIFVCYCAFWVWRGHGKG